ncbi:hypothetical protein [Luteimonas terrae]|uniref:Magnesium-transporting ATPase (P-type) n=1 Tax=Luteimonas terrae TaxID=1530191 RepID=A0ABU1XU60_9GAMM|nr:hypothetical protein [Luteimonas terrae]MDR7191621.1 magnesium-transporting ATPase (P-type) [Luteimonas terrae]
MRIASDWLILACGLHSAAFALFHLGFWRLFDWPRTLMATTRPNRAIVQIANAQLVWVFGAVALLCFVMPAELAATPLGRAVLAGMAGFWWLRLVLQFVWLRVRHPLVHRLSVTFLVGAMLFTAAAVR